MYVLMYMAFVHLPPSLHFLSLPPEVIQILVPPSMSIVPTDDFMFHCSLSPLLTRHLPVLS